MAAPVIEKKQYTCAVVDRFTAQGSIFLVDYSKAQAAETLCSLISRQGFASFLLIAENPAAAADFAAALAPAIGESTVVDSYARFVEIIGNDPAAGYDAACSVAKSLVSDHKCLILSAVEADGSALFHRRLCPNAGKNGLFAGDRIADYCISDLLADAGYAFVVVDDVYGQFALVEGASDDEEHYPPALFDKLHFYGKSFYSDTAHSYRRLEQLLTGAEHRVILSDTVIRGNVAELYAALRLVTSSFSLRDARRRMRKATSFYEEDCERICVDVAYAREDDSVISGCLRRTKGFSGINPSDVAAMQRHFRESFPYMSDEEIFLYTVEAYTKHAFKGRFPGLEAIEDRLGLGETEDMVSCLLEIFFSDDVRARIESTVTGTRVSDLDAGRLAALFSLFCDYGAYRYLPPCEDGIDIRRVKRDNSGFEYFVDQQALVKAPADSRDWTILTGGSDRLCKCMAVADFYESDKPASLIVVTSSREAQTVTAAYLTEMVGHNASVTTELVGSLDGKLVVTHYGALFASAQKNNASSIVFVDILPDMIRLKLLLHKLYLPGIRMILLGSYEDFSGPLLDQWQKTLLTPCDLLPFDSIEITMENNAIVSYTDFAARIAAFYSLLAETVKHGLPSHPVAIAQAFNGIYADYTLKTTLPEDEIKIDAEYLARLGVRYDTVFRHTASVLRDGEHILHKKPRPVQNPKSKAHDEFDTQESDIVYFNACGKMLRHACDLLHHNCADCPAYRAHLMNRFVALEPALHAFFSETLAYDAVMEKKQEEMVIRRTINTDNTNTVDYLVAEDVIKWREEAEAALENIRIESEKYPAFFWIDVNYVRTIRSAVYRSYKEMLKKYYTPVDHFFSEVTGRAISCYNSVSDVGRMSTASQNG